MTAGPDTIPISAGKVVSLRYIMRNGRGEELENNMSGQPVAYLHGAEGIQPVLQEQLEGLVTGAGKTVWLPGERDDSFSFEVIIDQVRNALPEEQLLGYPLRVPSCPDDCDCYTDPVTGQSIKNQPI